MDGPKHPQYRVVTDQEEVSSVFKNLKELAERGELPCVAMRVYNVDGTWEDIVLGGGSEEERANALASLQAAKRRAN
jgi:hypothetical protein